MSLDLIRIAIWMVAIVLLFIAAGIDMRDRVIPNRLVALIGASGLVLSLVSRPERLWISLLAAVVVLLGLGFLAHFRWIGGGDVKLISAVTLLVPPEHIGLLLLAIALVGGVISCCYLAAYYVFTRSHAGKIKYAATTGLLGKFPQLFRSERARVLTATSVPYGAAVLGGVAVVTVSEAIKCLSATSCSL